MEAFEAPIDLRVGEAAGQLPLEPDFDPHLHHPIDIPGAGTVSETVEQMRRGLSLRQPRLPPWQLRGLSRGGR